MGERLQRVADAHVEKAVVAGDVRDTLLRLCAAAPLLRDRYARAFALDLGITEIEAHAILQDFAKILLDETEGIAEQGHDAIMRLQA